MGMASVNVNIRMDAELKKEFEAFCSNVGMNMTTAFTIFARRTVRENRIPFEVSADCRREEGRPAVAEAGEGLKPVTNKEYNRLPQ